MFINDQYKAEIHKSHSSFWVKQYTECAKDMPTSTEVFSISWLKDIKGFIFHYLTLNID